MQESIGEVAAVAEQSSASSEEVSASTEQTSASAEQIAASARSSPETLTSSIGSSPSSRPPRDPLLRRTERRTAGGEGGDADRCRAAVPRATARRGPRRRGVDESAQPGASALAPPWQVIDRPAGHGG